MAMTIIFFKLIEHELEPKTFQNAQRITGMSQMIAIEPEAILKVPCEVVDNTNTLILAGGLSLAVMAAFKAGMD